MESSTNSSSSSSAALRARIHELECENAELKAKVAKLEENNRTLTLAATPVGRLAGQTTRSVSFSSACVEKFTSLRAVRQWAWTGGGSISFFGGDPIRQLSDFSPVQDGTGVYLRGGFEDDAGVYELRQPDQ